MSRVEPAIAGRADAGAAPPAWWVVLSREFTDLWVGGKGLTLVLAYSLALGLWSYILASNTELRLIPPKEMVWEMLEATISISCFICLIAAADAISGDRERAILEGLLLTPASRRQIVLGKYLAALSLWPAFLAVTIPYLAVLAQGEPIFPPAVLWGTLLGSVMVPGMAALGMLVSLWSNTIKTSMFTTLGIFILVLTPQSLPGHVQSGPIGRLLEKLSPLMATHHFLAKILVNNRSVAEFWPWLLSPLLFAGVMLGVLFVASPGLRLEAGQTGRLRSLWGRVLGVFSLVGFLALSPAASARAQESASGSRPAVADSAGPPLAIAIDIGARVVSQSDSVVYKTVVTNRSGESSRPLTVAMNIINLDSDGDVVDPEDWSPRRTQYIDPLEPGEAATLSWRVNAILDGDYMVYMVVIPKPDRPEATTQPVVTSGIHLTVKPAVKLNPRGILLYVIGTPLLLILVMIYLYHRRRRATEMSTG